MLEVRAPDPVPEDGRPKVFLAGSIEQGSAPDWQADVVEALEDLDIILVNPRREAWDSSWPQDESFGPFREQVEWELEQIERADLVLMVFSAGTRSPVSLLEMGVICGSEPGKLVVCCEPDFWRAGNVRITGQRYGVPCLDSLDAALATVRNRLSTI